MHCTINLWKKLVMPCAGLKPKNPRSFWETLMHMLGPIPRYGGGVSDADVNDYGKLLLQLCCNNALWIMNTFFQHRDVRVVQRLFGQRSLIVFCIVSANFRSALNVRVKRVQNCRPIATCLSATCFWKSRRAYINRQGQEVLPTKVGGPGGQRWQ